MIGTSLDHDEYPCPPLLEPLSWNDFVFQYVHEHHASQTRPFIITGYKAYLRDFKQLVGVGFKQWVNGSFTTNKSNPEDIDIICFVAHEAIASATFEQLSIFQTNGGSRDEYCVDAYIIPVYPKDSDLYITRTLLVANNWAAEFGFDKVTGKQKNVAQLLFP